MGQFSIEGPGSEGQTSLTDVNGVPIDSGVGGPTPNGELLAGIKPGQWFGPVKAEEAARRSIASQMKRSNPGELGQAAEVAGLDVGAVVATIISPFVHHRLSASTALRKRAVSKSSRGSDEQASAFFRLTSRERSR